MFDSQGKQFVIGMWLGILGAMYLQDRHGSKQAYIEHIQNTPEAWNGWVQIPVGVYAVIAVVLLGFSVYVRVARDEKLRKVLIWLKGVYEEGECVRGRSGKCAHEECPGFVARVAADTIVDLKR